MTVAVAVAVARARGPGPLPAVGSLRLRRRVGDGAELLEGPPHSCSDLAAGPCLPVTLWPRGPGAGRAAVRLEVSPQLPHPTLSPL